MADKNSRSEKGVMIGKDEMRKLIKKGEKTGVLSFAEINDAISDDLQSFEQIDDIVIQFQELGIELVGDRGEDTSAVKPGKAKSPKKASRSSKNKRVKASGSRKSNDDEGLEKNVDKKGSKGALSSGRERSDMEFGAVTDPVKMYLKEMGMVTLLSREGEIEIAKKNRGWGTRCTAGHAGLSFGAEYHFYVRSKNGREGHAAQTRTPGRG